MSFFQFRLIDIIDIVFVASILYFIYIKVKGTIALNILLGFFAFIIFWLTIRSLKMSLTISILDNFVNVGVLAIIIVFQQEIRQLFLRFGLRHKWLYSASRNSGMIFIDPIIKACDSFVKTRTGAIFVIKGQAQLKEYVESGEKLNAQISFRLIESLFFKNSPLHDGAIIISQDMIEAAGCILPISQNPHLPKNMGLRHRAAMGITEVTDATAIVISEERGEISYFKEGKYKTGLSSNDILKLLMN
jgi:diadenylate cyclase